MPDIVSANFVTEIKAKKDAIAAELSSVVVTAANVASVLVAAVTTQKVGVAAVLRDQIQTTSSTAALAAAGNAVNTTGKFTGKLLFNTDTGILVAAAGASAASVWKNVGTGATAHTPV